MFAIAARLRSFWGRMMCALGPHPCRTLSTDAGIGGQCVRCRRIFGWVTRDELRAYGARRSRPPAECEFCGDRSTR